MVRGKGGLRRAGEGAPFPSRFITSVPLPFLSPLCSPQSRSYIFSLISSFPSLDRGHRHHHHAAFSNVSCMALFRLPSPSPLSSYCSLLPLPSPFGSLTSHIFGSFSPCFHVRVPVHSLARSSSFPSPFAVCLPAARVTLQGFSGVQLFFAGRDCVVDAVPATATLGPEAAREERRENVHRERQTDTRINIDSHTQAGTGRHTDIYTLIDMQTGR